VTDVPRSHPRYASLRLRDAIVHGIEIGITSPHGLIAHGRGEAFDYLIGEQTNAFASQAIRVAVARLRTARHPVLSINGNTAALVPDDIVRLSRALRAPIEVNIFHASTERERAIAAHLQQSGAETVLLPDPEVTLDHIDSNRRFVHPDGLAKADVVFVPLEDGDRCEALVRAGVEVITIDLNPLSRTAQRATITIVDNLSRAMPALVAEAMAVAATPASELNALVEKCDNAAFLAAAIERIRAGVL
jgi:4-phosphopantoate--beta-alanine ligase